MKRPLRIPQCLCVAVALLLPHRLLAQGTNGSSAYNYILDSDVPESPAFVLLGVHPSKVYGASSLKPVMVDVASDLLSGGKIGSGIAFDFSPYLTLFGGGTKSINEYQASTWASALTNLQVSLATLTPASDTNVTEFSFGLRTVLFDAHDPLQNKALVANVSNALLATTHVLRPGQLDTTNVVTSGQSNNMKQVYATARDAVSKLPGSALSIAGGLAGHYSYISGGAVIDSEKFWVSYTYYQLVGGLDFLSTAQYTTPGQGNWTAGAALRGTSDLLTLDAEVLYDGLTKGLEGGSTLDIKVTTGLRVVLNAQLVKTSPDGSDYRIKTVTSFKWNMGN